MIELVVVIVVLSILASFAFVSYRGVVGRAQDDSTVATLGSVGREAGMLAQLANRNVVFADVQAAVADLPEAQAPGINAAAWGAVDVGMTPDPCSVGGVAAETTIYFDDRGDGLYRLAAMSPTGKILTIEATGAFTQRKPELDCTAPPVPTTPPDAPTHPTIAPGDGSVTLGWTGTTNTASYVVERSPITTASWTEIAEGFPGPLDVAAANGTTFQYRIRSRNAAGLSAPSSTVTATATPTSAYANAVMASGPSAYWRFEESGGTTAFDSSPNRTHLTQTGTAAIGAVPSPLTSGGQAFGSATTTNRFLQSTTLPQLANNFTHETWIKASPSLTDYQNLQTRQQSGRGYNLQKHSNTTSLAFRIDTDAGTNQTQLRIPNLIDNTWHHIVVTVSGGTARGYRDGVLVATATYLHGAGMPSPYLRVTGSSLVCIDEVALYDRVLPVEEIAAHYTAR